MKNKTTLGFLIILGAAILTSAAFIIGPWQPAEIAAPEKVVTEFYTAYLSYPGNPLVEKMYRGSTILSPSLIAFLDEYAAGAMIVDPVICAQTKPESILADRKTVKGDRAWVTVYTNFEGHQFEIELTSNGNTWVIDQINCQGGLTTGSQGLTWALH